MRYFKDGSEVSLLSSLFDKTKIRRLKEYGKYNTELRVKNLCSFCGVSHLTRNYSYGHRKGC